VFAKCGVHIFDAQRCNLAFKLFAPGKRAAEMAVVDELPGERGLSPADVAALVKIASPRAKRALDTINERAVALKKKHKDPTQANMRIGVGFYFYSEPLDAPGGQLLLD
jgi:hypothetical protein